MKAVFICLFVLLVAPSVMAAIAVPEVFTDVTMELGGCQFGVRETERIQYHTFGSAVVPGRQVEVYFLRYLTAIPCSLGVFVSLLVVLSIACVWLVPMTWRKS